MSERDELAEVLAAHRMPVSRCICGWRPTMYGPAIQHAAHVADALLDWLAQRDRLVAADALREAAEEAHREARDVAERTMRGQRPDPLESVTLLEIVFRERADRIEAGE